MIDINFGEFVLPLQQTFYGNYCKQKYFGKIYKDDQEILLEMIEND